MISEKKPLYYIILRVSCTVRFIKRFTTWGDVFKGKLVISGHQNFKSQLIIYPGIAHNSIRSNRYINKKEKRKKQRNIFGSEIDSLNINENEIFQNDPYDF